MRGGTLSHGTRARFASMAAPIPATLILSQSPDLVAPTLQLTGGLSKTLAPAGAVGLVVGDDAGAGTWTGTLLIDGGADLIMSGTSKDINIGDDAGTTGNIMVTGAGSRLVATDPGDDIRVGFQPESALLTSTTAGRCWRETFLVPAIGTARGNIEMIGSGSTLTTANLSIGAASGAPGSAVVDGVGCVINATDPGIGVIVRETGFMATYGTLNATGTILLDGGELEVHGTVSPGVLLDVAASGVLCSGFASLPARVNGPVRVRSGGEIHVTTHHLTIGSASLTSGVIMDLGSLTTVGIDGVSVKTLELVDADEAQERELSSITGYSGRTTASTFPATVPSTAPERSPLQNCSLARMPRSPRPVSMASQ